MNTKLIRWASLAIISALLVTPVTFRARADEGFFLPDSLHEIGEKELQRRGLKIPLTDIYHSAGISMKDAVVMVNNGTGEFVSPDGLLLTNHHVGFGALVSASDSTNDYGRNGYKASSRAEELPAQNYTVTITQDLKDVTGEILKGIGENTTFAARAETIAKRISQMEAAGRNAAGGISVRVLPISEGLSYYKFTYLTLSDIRIVYAPPKNIGFFGGDADNFEWPRHTGDFMFMRAYVGPDGKPAAYSANNVPFKPKKFLTLSLAGVKEGDFLMVLGYPNNSRRYRESFSMAYNQDFALPFSIEILTEQLKVLRDVGKNDQARRVALQSAIFSTANEKKNNEGTLNAMRRSGFVERKRMEETAFARWLESDPARKQKYGEVLPELNKAYEQLNASAIRDLIVPQIFLSSSLLTIAVAAREAAVNTEKADANSAASAATARTRARDRAIKTLADRNVAVERHVLTYLLRKAAQLPEGQKIEPIEKRFAGLEGNRRRRAEEDFVRTIVDVDRFAAAGSVDSFFKLSAAELSNLHEPFVDFATELGALLSQQRSRPQFATIGRYRQLLFEGMIEMNGKIPYPDANRTLRFTYGKVKGFTSYDAKVRPPFTNLAGTLEKDQGREPFNVPERLRQLYRTRDFGQYATADGANVTVNFLTDTDIISGNSGSPVLNGRGEQVGIIFDNNYEGLGNNFFYNGERGRSIAVDIRYVLFVADKFGDAGYLLKELNLQNKLDRLQSADIGR